MGLAVFALWPLTVAILHAIGIWNDLIVATIYLTNKAYYPVTRGLIVFTVIVATSMAFALGAHRLERLVDLLELLFVVGEPVLGLLLEAAHELRRHLIDGKIVARQVTTFVADESTLDQQACADLVLYAGVRLV